MRLLCDLMLGSLAKWLRYLGHDVLYAGPRDPGDDELARIALSEERTLITRDEELAGRVRKHGGAAVLVVSRDLDGQLEQVVPEVGIVEELVLRRCAECNDALDAASGDEVAGRVPREVLARHSTFQVCRGCARVYWQGSHFAAIADRIGRLRVLASGRDALPTTGASRGRAQ